MKLEDFIYHWWPVLIGLLALLFLVVFAVGVLIHGIWFYDGIAEKETCPVVEVDGRQYRCVP